MLPRPQPRRRRKPPLARHASLPQDALAERARRTRCSPISLGNTLNQRSLYVEPSLPHLLHADFPFPASNFFIRNYLPDLPFPARTLSTKSPARRSFWLPARLARLPSSTSPYRRELDSPPGLHLPCFLFWLRLAAFLRGRSCSSARSAFHSFSTSPFVTARWYY